MSDSQPTGCGRNEIWHEPQFFYAAEKDRVLTFFRERFGDDFYWVYCNCHDQEKIKVVVPRGAGEIPGLEEMMVLRLSLPL